MKKSIILLPVLLFVTAAFSQDLKTFKLYKPEENAEQKNYGSGRASQSGR